MFGQSHQTCFVFCVDNFLHDQNGMIYYHPQYRSPRTEGTRCDDKKRSGEIYSSKLTWVWTIFRGMNIHKSQLFWCELQGYKVLTHCHITMENQLVWWVVINYEWPCSMAMLKYKRGYTWATNIPRCSMVLVYLPTFGWFLGQMLVNIPAPWNIWDW